MIDSNDLIHRSDISQQASFAAKVENMSMREGELEEAASRLGVNLPAGADWREYRDAFSNYSWKDVTYAMEHASGGQDYSRI